MWLRTRYSLAFDVLVPTPFVLMLRPRSGRAQWVAAEEYRLEPETPVFEFTDRYGNLCQRLVARPGPFSVNTVADVRTAERVDTAPGAPFVAVQELPDDVLDYLLPSRYCESDRLLAAALEITRGKAPGYDQVTSIVDWIRREIPYDYAGSESLVSAAEVLQRKTGVCRDYAHLGIALCRSLCIPARMVVGYLYELQPMDLHAWFEAYVGDRWYSFDPTQKDMKGARVSIAYGRDAADVAIYHQFGPPARCRTSMYENHC